LFGDAGVSGKFVQGVTMGATVGAVAGTMFGLLSYMQHRRLIYVPIIACSMAISFGFFMGVGTVIRTDNESVLMDRISFVNNKIIIEPPLWKEKYRKFR
jgi:Reactive mitochondrial oxygen species modulator 1.